MNTAENETIMPRISSWHNLFHLKKYSKPRIYFFTSADKGRIIMDTNTYMEKIESVLKMPLISMKKLNNTK